MSTQQCWRSLCLLEEEMRHIFSQLNQAFWLPQIFEVALFMDAYELSINNYFNCITRPLPKSDQNLDGLNALPSIIIRIISMELTFVKVLRTLPQPVRTAIFSHVDNNR